MAEYDAAHTASREDGSAAAPSRARAALEQFVKKCLYLAAKRIQELCLRLLLESSLTQQVWDVAKLVLDMARDLLVGRHLDQVREGPSQIWLAAAHPDCILQRHGMGSSPLVSMCSLQILLCAVYGVCKVNQRQVTFRQIIEQYKRQPGASPRTFREVRMKTADEDPQDIIQFYNLIFIPTMKEHLLRVDQR